MLSYLLSLFWLSLPRYLYSLETIQFKEMTRNDSMSFFPSKHRDITEYPGMVYSMCAKNHPKAVLPSLDPVTVLGIPESTPDLTFIAFFDTIVDGRYLSSIYYSNRKESITRLVFVSDKIESVSEMNPFNNSYYLSHQTCTSILIAPFYDASLMTPTIQENVYCFDNYTLSYFSTWKGSPTNFRPSLFKHDRLSDMEIPRRFRKLTLEGPTLRNLLYLYFKIPSPASPPYHNAHLYIVETTPKDPPKEHIVDLNSSLALGGVVSEMIDVYYVVVHPMQHFGSPYLTMHIVGFAEWNDTKGYVLVDCLFNTTALKGTDTYNLLDCFIVEKLATLPNILQIRSLSYDPIVSSHTIKPVFEILQDNGYRLLSYTEKTRVTSKNTPRVVSNIIVSELRPHRLAKATGALDSGKLSVDLAMPMVRNYSIVAENGKREFCFYELVVPQKNNLFVYDHRFQFMDISVDNMFVGINFEGLLIYMKESPIRLSVDLNQVANFAESAISLSVPYFNVTIDDFDFVGIRYNMLDRNLVLQGIRLDDYPLKEIETGLTKINENWLNIKGPAFYISQASGSSKEKVEIVTVDANQLRYFTQHHTANAPLREMNMSTIVATKDTAFDFGHRILYSCRVFTSDNGGKESYALCSIDQNFSKKIPSLRCDKLVSSSLTENRVAVLCENFHPTEYFNDYQYHMIDLELGKYESGSFGPHPQNTTQQTLVLCTLNFVYFIASDQSIKGVFRDWDFRIKRPFLLGFKNVTHFSAVFSKATQFDLTDLVLGVAQKGRYNLVQMFQGDIYNDDSLAIVPGEGGNRSVFCPMTNSLTYTKNGNVYLYDERMQEFSLFPASNELVLDTLICVDRFTSLVFWRYPKIRGRRYYAVLRDRKDLHSYRLTGQMLFTADGISSSMHRTPYFVDQSDLYLLQPGKGPLVFNLAIPKAFLRWEQLPPREITFTLQDAFLPQFTKEVILTLDFVTDNNASLFTETFLATNNTFGEWNITYLPLNQSEGHFWKIVPSGPMQESAKLQVTHRFDKLVIFPEAEEIPLDKKEELPKFKSYLSTDNFDVYLNDTHVFLRKPLSTEIIGEFYYLDIELTDIVEAGRYSTSQHWILFKGVDVASLNFQFMVFDFNTENKDNQIENAEMKEAFWTDLEASDTAFRVSDAGAAPIVGFLRPTLYDRLIILAPNCTGNNEMYFGEDYVDYFDLFERDDHTFVFYASGKERKFKMRRIDGPRGERTSCENTEVELQYNGLEQQYFEEIDCESGPPYPGNIECVLAGTKTVWIKIELTAENKAEVTIIREYESYKDLDVEQILISTRHDRRFFLVRGTRMNLFNNLLSHDRGGVLYYDPPGGNSNFSQGGLPELDLIGSGIGKDYQIAISDNGTVVIDGDDTILFYKLETPKLTGHSLVEREKRHEVIVTIYGYDTIPAKKLEPIQDNPGNKRKPTKNRTEVIVILAIILCLGLCVTYCLLNCIRKHHPKNKDEYLKDSFIESGEYQGSFFAPGDYTVESPSLLNKQNREASYRKGSTNERPVRKGSVQNQSSPRKGSIQDNYGRMGNSYEPPSPAFKYRKDSSNENSYVPRKPSYAIKDTY